MKSSYRESFIDAGQLCIVMDYADGGDLCKRIKQQKQSGKSFSEEQVLRWFTQALLALRYMHEKHILHRDLKTQNFFLMKNGRLRVGDFGIAKVLESTTAFAQTQIGTPYYLSPEICQARPYTYASDIWALGCVLYEMAALTVPFDSPNIKGLVAKISNGPAPSIPSQYSSQLRELCTCMLDKDWKQRPSADDLCKKKIVQDTIRAMLEEEKSQKPKESVDAPSSPRPPVEQSKPSPSSDSANKVVVKAADPSKANVKGKEEKPVSKPSSIGRLIQLVGGDKGGASPAKVRH